MSMVRDSQGKAKINIEIYNGKQNKFLVKLLNLLHFLYTITFSWQHQKKKFLSIFLLWSVEIIFYSTLPKWMYPQK